MAALEVVWSPKFDWDWLALAVIVALKTAATGYA